MALVRPGSLAIVAGAAIYIGGVRPWMLRWGSTDKERREPLPGDTVVPRATLSVTRAIDIAAPPTAVWPWLVQLGYGPGRAGFYSYDALENLVGLGIHSAGRILPELQTLRAGDRIPLGPETAFGVHVAEPPDVLVLEVRMHPFTGRDVGRDATVALHWTWAFILRARPDGTRLLIRTRGRWRPPVLRMLIEPVIEPIWFVMERRMLLGIRERAERLPRRGHEVKRCQGTDVAPRLPARGSRGIELEVR